MEEHRVQVYRPGQGNADTVQTSGMEREELIASERAWVGVVRTAPGFASGWHHHGDFDTYVYVISGEIRLEFGEGGQEECTAGPGDVLYVPGDAVHRESNAAEKQQVGFVVRVGEGVPVTNVDGPDAPTAV